MTFGVEMVELGIALSMRSQEAPVTAWGQVTSDVAGFFGLEAAYGPVLLIGLAFAVAIPVLAVIGLAFRSDARARAPNEGWSGEAFRGDTVADDEGQTRKAERNTLIQPARSKLSADEQNSGAGPVDGPVVAGRRLTTQVLRAPPRARGAALVVATSESGSCSDGGEGESHFPFANLSTMRIGREDDNDVVLPVSTVHRYHAVVRRTPDAGYVVFDLSGADGNGVVLNGERVSEAQLHDGDELHLGTARLRFVMHGQ